MSAYTKLALLKKQIISGKLEMTDDVVSELLMLEAEVTEGREPDEGHGAYFGDLLTYGKKRTILISAGKNEK